MSVTKSLLLTTFTWEEGNYKSFRMIPTSLECPYAEVFYDPVLKVLVLFAKEKTEHFTVLDKLNEFGDVAMHNKQTLKDRHLVNAFKEHIIEEPDEIKSFIELFAINADSFQYQQFFDNMIPAPQRLVSGKVRKMSTADFS